MSLFEDEVSCLRGGEDDGESRLAQELLEVACRMSSFGPNNASGHPCGERDQKTLVSHPDDLPRRCLE